ncbi:MAG TPA: crotonase/enoyl-CoA hydratase family protein [Nannocystis exedens]|nr:crotonase/enoyl-CoA hydratase family protein [Nannocystis exedens]
MNDDATDCVRVERAGPVTTIILSRPQRRNAVDGPTAAALLAAFRNFADDPEARVAVLWGEGGHFCAGADLKAVAQGTRMNSIDPEGPGPMGPTRLLLDKPVIAAIAGYAVAGGLELALWADLRVAEENATFGVFCRRFGVPLIDGGTVRLPRLIGHGRALDLILTGRAVDAEEALRIGLVDRVVPANSSRDRAQILARQIAAFPQACLRADRLATYRQWDLGLAEALRTEGRGGIQALEIEGLQGARNFAAGSGRHGIELNTTPVACRREDIGSTEEKEKDKGKDKASDSDPRPPK